jgi:hypothetical protein
LSSDGVVGLGGAICNAEKPDAGVCVLHTLGDQVHLGTCRTARNRQQLNTVANRPDWADKIMANARPDQRCNILCHAAYPPEKGRQFMDMTSILTPGMFVRHPDQPEWGVGQVQSNIGGKVTVNFREEGKVVLEGARAMLILVQDAENTT